jgi:hypothetical protein
MDTILINFIMTIKEGAEVMESAFNRKTEMN